MKVLVDTNRLTDALRGDEALVSTLERCEEISIPFVALAELKAGFLAGSRREDNEASLNRLLNLPGVAILYADRETTNFYARLYVYLRKVGTPIPTNDLWIASLAMQHNLMLLTRDQHFEKLPQIARS